MVSISGPPSLSQLQFGLLSKRRNRGCSNGDQGTFCTVAVVRHHKSHNVGSEHIDTLLLQGYGHSRCLKGFLNKHRLILTSYSRGSELTVQEPNSSSKSKRWLPCSFSEGSALNRSPKLDSHVEKLMSDSLKDEKPASSSLEKSPQFCPNEEHINGRSGFASFYRNENLGMKNIDLDSIKASPDKKALFLLWLVAPATLVASVVIPPIFFQQLVAKVLADNLMRDFIILFSSETAFYVGVYIFLYIAKMFSIQVQPQKPDRSLAVRLHGYKLSSLICLGISATVPVLAFYVVWPWIGPAAAAALVPFLVGLRVQCWFEERTRGSSISPLVEIIFQVYRLHQLNRAAQLVVALLFSLKDIESTVETLAINRTLQTLMKGLQLLGIVSLWSLGSFLVQTASMRERIAEP